MINKKIDNKILVITGPTASGKSSAAIEVADKINGEIISCDSAQVYKFMDIGTAKPSSEQMQGIPHHLIDVVYPDYDYTAADFKRDCSSAVHDIISRGKTPIICGGTGLYLDAFLYDMDLGGAPANMRLRGELSILYDIKGSDFSHELLCIYDPKTAERLHKNDKKRVVRALEVCFLTNRPLSSQNNFARPALYNHMYVVLTCDRPQLYQDINLRTQQMIQSGLVEEVDYLLKSGYGHYKSMQAIGYKEIAAYLSGEVDQATAIEKLKQNTRNYAKRQITWFKTKKSAFFISNQSNICAEILKHW